jgi:tetratricopeptide (TPR) repeat protein
MRYAIQDHDLERQSALLMNLGMLAWFQHDPEEAIRLSEESLRLARQIHHQRRISSVLQNLGMIMRHQDQVAMAEQYLHESLELAQRIGHRWLICETLGEVGLLALKQRQTPQAKQHFAEMLRQAQEIQAPLLQGLALFGSAQAAEQEGQRCEALRSAQESLAIFIHLNNQIMIQEIEVWRTVLSQECFLSDR